MGLLIKAENIVFFPDSPFADWIINRCEKLFPGINDYVSFGANSKNLPLEKIRMVGLGLRELKSFAKELKNYKRIIIHYHHDITGFLIELANVPSEKIIWMLWSGDLYNSPFYKGKVYLTETINFGVLNLPKPLNSKDKIKEWVKDKLQRPSIYNYRRSFNRIRNLGSFFSQDVENASATFGNKYNQIFHGIISVNEQLDLNRSSTTPILGSSIIIGHSGVPELNHLDVFMILSKLGNERSVICPLAYGNPIYIEKVIQEGELTFGNRFEPIQAYMPREAYYEKLEEASFAIFGSVIHQGFGNIMALLYLGIKVFMYKENPNFQTLSDFGIVLFSIEEIDSSSFVEGLTAEQKKINKSILEKILSDDQVDLYYHNIYQYQAFA